MIAPAFSSGEVLDHADLNTLAAMADAAAATATDGASGLPSVSLPSGTAVRGRRRLSCWALITGGGASGKYAATEQLETSGGGWATGPRTWTTTGTYPHPLTEVNGNASVPNGSTRRVRAWCDRFGWWFQYVGST